MARIRERKGGKSRKGLASANEETRTRVARAGGRARGGSR